MITKYKGFEIDVTRDTTMSGVALFSYINRLSDGHLIYEEMRYDAVESVREAIKNLKNWIDEEEVELKYMDTKPDINLYNELIEHEENNILYSR